jgi:rod shape-determining protein MreB and related proteins
MTISIPRRTRWHWQAPHIDSQHLWNSIKRFGRFSNHLGIDLGTSKTSIFMPEQGIVLQEPSVVAINKNTQQPVAFGTAAKDLIGRSPEHIEIIRPIQNGAIANINVTVQMLAHFIQQAQSGMRVLRPLVTTGYAHSAPIIERQALLEVMSEAGARKVSLIDKSVAAAIGADLPLDHANGKLIVDIGGGTTEVAIIGPLGTVVGLTSWGGGDELDQAIHDFLKSEHHLLIGELMAERIKLKYGSAIANPEQDNQEVSISGLDQVSLRCTSVSVRRGDLRVAMSPSLMSIADAVKRVLEMTPPELISDVADRGLILTGGGALLPGIVQFISHEVNMFVQAVPDPINSVAMGIGQTLENSVPIGDFLASQPSLYAV